MAALDSRRRLTALTLTILLAILVVGLAWGWRSFTAPIDEATGQPKGASPSCAAVLDEGSVVKVSDVTVSVYNAGTRSGLADRTLDQLTKRGFLKGKSGNAPATFDTTTVRVLADSKDDPAAQLVALQFGPLTKITVAKDDLGPGVDVVIGDRLQALVKKAPKALKAQAAGSGC